MKRPALSGETAARWLRRAVVAMGAAGLLVLPQFSTSASFPPFLGAPGLPGPMAVLVLGLALWMMPILVVASWVAARRAVMPHAWAAIPVGLLVAGAIISTYVADDKAAATVRAAQVTGLAVGFWALVQALRSDAERRLLVAALLAAAVVAAACAVYQATVGLPAAWEYFQAHRSEVLAQQGIAPGSWAEQAFAARFTGGVQAAMGHPNVLATFLVVAALVAAGLVREKWSEAASRGARALAVVIVAAILVCAAGTFLTQGRAAEAALVVGLYWLAVAWRARRRPVRIALYVLPLAVAAAALVVAACVDHPAVASALKTLRYRLDYWQATVEVLRAHGLAGVGLENFGPHYVQHKVPWAPEEVSDPHQMLLSVWSQLGLAGLAGLVLLAAGAVREWLRGGLDRRQDRGLPPSPGLRRTGPAAARDEAEPAADAPGDSLPAPGTAAAGSASLLGLLVPTLAVAAPAVIFYFSVGWFAGVEAVALMVILMGLAMAEEPSRLEASGRPLRSLRVACIVALAAFVLQEQIGTAILEPPTAWAMLAVLAVSLGPGRGGGRARGEASSPASGASEGGPPGVPLPSPVRFLLMVSAMAVAYLYVTQWMVPVGREESLLGMAAETPEAMARDEILQAAGAANPLAWEPAMIRGRQWQEAAGRAEEPGDALALERATAAYREALGRRPSLRRAVLALAECRLTPPGALEDRAALAAAREYIEMAARMYPTDLATRLRLADLTDRLGEPAAALEAYREVLRLDGLMPEPGRRLRAEDRLAVERRVEELADSLAAPAPAP